MADTYKIKALLDTDDVKRGAREIEREISGAANSVGGGAGGGGAVPTLPQGEVDTHKEVARAIEARTSATNKLVESTQRLSTQQKTGMILGGGVAAAQLAGSVMKANGMDTGAGMLTSAASSAARLGTMLAPLGPQAAIIGAAAGGITGAITSLVGSMAEAQKELAKQAEQAKKDAEALRKASSRRRADEIVSRKDFETLAKTDPEAAKTFLAGIRKELEVAMISAKEGATIEQDLRKTALYYPEETKQVLRAGGRTISPEQEELRMALEDPIRERAQKAYDDGDFQKWVLIKDEILRKEQMFPELMSRSLGDSATSRLGDVGMGDGKAAEQLSKAGKASGSMGSVDSLQSIGLGVYANPMQRSEQLLQSIDSKLAVISRKPQGGLL